MRIAEVIGSVTLSRVHPSMTGGALGHWCAVQSDRVA